MRPEAGVYKHDCMRQGSKNVGGNTFRPDGMTTNTDELGGAPSRTRDLRSCDIASHKPSDRLSGRRIENRAKHESEKSKRAVVLGRGNYRSPPRCCCNPIRQMMTVSSPNSNIQHPTSGPFWQQNHGVTKPSIQVHRSRCNGCSTGVPTHSPARLFSCACHGNTCKMSRKLFAHGSTHDALLLVGQTRAYLQHHFCQRCLVVDLNGILARLALF